MQLVRDNKITIESNVNIKRNYVSSNNINLLIEFLISSHLKNKCIPSIFNFGSDLNLTLLELSSKIIDIYNKTYDEVKSMKFKSEENILYSNFKYESNIRKLHNINSENDFNKEIKKLFHYLHLSNHIRK